MSLSAQCAIAAFFVLLAWLTGRWASLYDVKGWISDAALRLVFSGKWRQLRKAPVEVITGDKILKGQIKGSIDTILADKKRYGILPTTAKHGALYGLAILARVVSNVAYLTGFVLIAHAAYRWLA